MALTVAGTDSQFCVCFWLSNHCFIRSVSCLSGETSLKKAISRQWVSIGGKGACSSPVVSPIHAFVRRGRSCFTQPSDNFSGNLFLSVPPHEPRYFSFSVDGLFVPLLFCQVCIVADRFAGRTELRNVTVMAADKQVFDFQWRDFVFCQFLIFWSDS